MTDERFAIITIKGGNGDLTAFASPIIENGLKRHCTLKINDSIGEGFIQYVVSTEPTGSSFRREVGNNHGRFSPSISFSIPLESDETRGLLISKPGEAWLPSIVVSPDISRNWGYSQDFAERYVENTNRGKE
ncbi:MAG: hypothetical protein A2Z24_01125 [Candidatus Woykebacteria bacterium RBG_16_44_10]|uniref:Uncharacterized protein n=1 Tax=Candidatus Woykebacteria bacterium RBG_16_44_10 TaxID=1802597 RepID=A0A1G1WF90_9BACT|nr:MAG: hypothetical protein A2Z24_01125 [Candidatus Woykebacteria bacterium RBG_16_44_10]